MRLSACFSLFLAFFAACDLKAAVELQPHRAYYTVTMASRPSLQSNVVDVRGTMMLEVNKVCGGWTVQQLSEIWRYRDDETVEHVRWGYVTYEADDGSAFKFNTFRKVNDELIEGEDIRGQIKKNGKLIEALYEKPRKMTVTLPEGVLFPIQHTRALLKAAEEGEKMFPRVIFDGSTIEGATEINTFIGAKKIFTDTNAKGDSQQFSGQSFWPVRFAVYGLGGTDYEPEYTTTQELRTDGIIKQYVIDDGSTQVRGTLDRVELLNKEEC